MNLQVILNKDLAVLGEEGDIKSVTKGYARNFLFPRGIALPYTERNIKLFEGRKSEIEARKEEKRLAASGLKERLEAAEISITMPAGANGKLYGAVTSTTLVAELTKAGFEIERKHIEIPGNTIKSVGKYRATVKLYGGSSAELSVTVLAQPAAEEPKTEKPVRRGRYERHEESASSQSSDAALHSDVPQESVAPELAADAADVSTEASVPAEAPASTEAAV